MRYIAFTFDDGRRDSYTQAYPVMQRYGFAGTLFCTTGFIDGSWQKEPDWYSADEPIRIEELHKLQEAGWELALHGDAHITDPEDLKRASEKMTQWGFSKRPIGFSIPHCRDEREKLREIIDRYYGAGLLYVRAGMHTDKRSLRAKLLFGLYTYGRLQWAYNCFNRENLTELAHLDRKMIYSLVVRCKDDPGMIARFLEQIPDQTCAVLMFHSILPESDAHYGTDSWNWSLARFEKFCGAIHGLVQRGMCRVTTLESMLAETERLRS